MANRHRVFSKGPLVGLLSLLLTAGFFATSLSSYYVSKAAILEAIIDRELPLASSNIYSEIQKDLVRPVLVSSTMASDTFLRDWVLAGERDVSQIAKYLQEVKERYGAFSSFFVSDPSHNYYYGGGLLKQVRRDEPRDLWYWRVRDMKEDYEINLDPDMANRDALTIFINYKVFDFAGRYIGAAGVGLTVDAVRRLVTDYQQRYQRRVYFVDPKGRVVLFGSESGRGDTDLHAEAGLGTILDDILSRKSGSYQYRNVGGNRLLNVHFIPELNWYLFVEKAEDEALASIRKTLYVNLAICLAVTMIVVWLTYLALNRYQGKLEKMAATDELTGMLNRQAFMILLDKLMAEYRRNPRHITLLMVDVDHFKEINDRHGHQVGDRALRGIADSLQAALRGSDIAVRWGGEEFLILLKDCGLEEGLHLAEKLRQAVESLTGVRNLPCRITISIGVAEYDGMEAMDHAVARADQALYEAKRQGRNRVWRAAAGDATGSGEILAGPAAGH